MAKKKSKEPSPKTDGAPEEDARPRLKKKVYNKEMARLHIELVKLQEWIKHKGLKVVVLFEGRDAAGKGGVIKRITESLNPRVCRVVALGTPTDDEIPKNGKLRPLARSSAIWDRLASSALYSIIPELPKRR